MEDIKSSSRLCTDPGKQKTECIINSTNRQSKAVPLHAQQIQRIGGNTALATLYPGVRTRWLLNTMPWPLYSGKITRYPLDVYIYRVFHDCRE